MRAYAPLRNRTFSRLLGAYVANDLGDAMAVLALAVLVYDGTADPLATAGLFLAARFAPALLAPALTARVDQMSLKRSIPVLYVVEAVVFVVLAVTADAFILPLILVLAAVDGTLAVTGRALTRGAVGAVLTPDGTLREGNALMNVGFALSSVAGAALGGAIVAVWSVEAALIVDAVTFLVAGLVIATASGLPAAATEPERFLRRFREGLGHARQHRQTMLLIVGEGIALVCFTLVIPIEVIYAKETLDAGDSGFGLLLASWGVGILAGSGLYIGIRNRSDTLLVLGSTATIGAAYLGMSQADSLALACLFSVIGGIGNGIQWVAVMTLLQEQTPVDLQARVVGLMESVNAAAPGLGYLLGGLLTAVSSPREAYAAAGIGALVVVAAGGVAARRGLLRRTERSIAAETPATSRA